MNAGKHTPGPWAVRHDFKDACGTSGIGVAAASIGAGAGAVAWPCGVDEIQVAANARLIAVAPELLAALQDLVLHDGYETEYDGRIYMICPSCSKQDGTHGDRCGFVAARKLIAKATGEASHG
jgi:hypothetical protein